MLSKEDWMTIQAQAERGVYQRDIAAALGVHPRTVRRALARGGAPSPRRPGARKSILDPFKPEVDRLLQEGVWNAMVVLRELEARGYGGRISVVRNYIRPKRPLRVSRATVRFETPSGRQMQHDWGEVWIRIAGVPTKVYFTVNTLGYSRRFHFWCTDANDAEHTYEGIVRAFEWFGGVPAEVLVDNQKATVIRHRIGDRVQFHERFLDLAGHYGFTPRACRPYRARTKGKDERNVGYIKGNFFARYHDFDSYQHLNQLAEAWLLQEADPRVHGTVKEVVAERFRREAPQLGPLPATRYDTSYRETRWVAWDGYIEVRGNRYSLPDPYRGTLVAVRIGLDGRLLVLADDVVIAERQLRPASEGWVTDPDDHRSLWRRTLAVEHRDLRVYEEAAAWNS
jgi:transposase